MTGSGRLWSLGCSFFAELVRKSGRDLADCRLAERILCRSGSDEQFAARERVFFEGRVEAATELTRDHALYRSKQFHNLHTTRGA